MAQAVFRIRGDEPIGAPGEAFASNLRANARELAHGVTDRINQISAWGARKVESSRVEGAALSDLVAEDQGGGQPHCFGGDRQQSFST